MKGGAEIRPDQTFHITIKRKKTHTTIHKRARGEGEEQKRRIHVRLFNNRHREVQGGAARVRIVYEQMNIRKQKGGPLL